MGFKPKSNLKQSDEPQKEFVPIIPEDGLQAVQLSLLINLGSHPKMPKFAKDSAGKREKDKDGKDKILLPKEGKDTEQRVSAYVDLLNQTHDYGESIGVKNIRLPLHRNVRSMSEGIAFTTVAPRDADGNYIKGRQWLLAPQSQFSKIAKVTKYDDGKAVSDVIFDYAYSNKKCNDISELLGKPFLMNVKVNKVEKDGKVFVNSKLDSPVPLMKGMPFNKPLLKSLYIDLDDEDLLVEDPELGGACKFDFIRLADLRKIVLSQDYKGSKMQEAVQNKFDEKELIEDSKKIHKAIIESDKDLKEIKVILESGSDIPDEVIKAEAPNKDSKKEQKVVEDDDCPF